MDQEARPGYGLVQLPGEHSQMGYFFGCPATKGLAENIRKREKLVRTGHMVRSRSRLP